MGNNQFRILIIVQFALGLFGIISGVFIDNNLPVELQSYEDKLYDQPFTTIQHVFLFIAFIALASNILIFFFISWSRHLFTITYLICCLGTITLGPSIFSALETTLGELEIFLSGFIVCCMYLTDIKKNYIRTV